MSTSKNTPNLKERFEIIAANFPQDGNNFLERCVYDQVQKAGAECPGVSFEDVVVTANGLQVPCKWVRPEGTKSSKQVMLFMHGGGYSFGSPEGHRKLTAHLANACQCPALSVDYRLTPEHKYPAALDDCVAAYKYLLDQGYDAKRIAVAGDSCGGGLSTSLPLACVKQGLPVPGASVSLSPLYDASTQEGGTMDSNEQNDVLNTKPFVKMLAGRYVDGSGATTKDSLISPLFAKDDELAKMPPHWISIAGHDMLRDQGERMAERLKKNGVEVVAKVHEGQQHVMEFAAGKAAEADDSVRNIGEWVVRKIG